MSTGGKSKRPCHADLGQDALKIQSPTSVMPNPKSRKINRTLQTPVDFVIGSRDISVFEIVVAI